MSTVHVVGDIHGQIGKIMRLLRLEGLIDDNHHWQAGTDKLWFIGDFFDRGPDGVGAVELAMNLQQEAAHVGGEVNAILGNHDILILAAYLVPTLPSTGPGGRFIDEWRRYGNPADLNRLAPHHIDWLTQLPAMALEGDTLLIHADAPLYLEMGSSIPDVNNAMHDILQSESSRQWDGLLEKFSVHHWFYDDPGDTERAMLVLNKFGGKRLVHGHTPIINFEAQTIEEVNAPLIYANGLCINVDGGMFRGGRGFLYRVP